MNLSNSVLMDLVRICDDPECTTILIKKFINASDIKLLESRLKGCYESIRNATTSQEKEPHYRNRLLIEEELDRENKRSVDIDDMLDPIIENLAKDRKALYEKVLADFKSGKY